MYTTLTYALEKCSSRPSRKSAEQGSDFLKSWTVQETQRAGWILSLLVSRKAEFCDEIVR